MYKIMTMTLVVLGLLSFPSSASAHGDVNLVDGVLTIAPGESARFDGELHYHRLIGRIQADGPVSVQLIQPGAAEPAFAAGPDAEFSFNELIRCCDDRVWTPYEFVIQNTGATTATVGAHAFLVHDDLAIMVYGAESGTRTSIPVMGALWAVVLWRGSRRRRVTLPLSRSLAAFGALAASIGVLGWYGALRYDTTGAPALVAALGSLPIVPVNSIASRSSLVIFIAVIVWGLAGYWWARSRASTSATAWIALGLGLAAMPVVTAGLIASAYESVAVPAVMATLAVIPILVVVALDLRRRSSKAARLA